MKYQDPEDMSVEEMREYIRLYLAKATLLEQLGEEAGELCEAGGRVAKNANKLIRAAGWNGNPTPETVVAVNGKLLDSVEAAITEMLDVLNVITILYPSMEYKATILYPMAYQEKKLRRWVKRIQEKAAEDGR